MEVNKIYCESCLDTMSKMDDGIVDIILTSPPYNTNKAAGRHRTLETDNHKWYPNVRYDSYVDTIPNEEYISKSVNLFNNFDRILVKDGCVLYNMSYGSNNPHIMYDTIYNIIHSTPFSLADTIVWKKKSALPVWTKNKLTRQCEFIFVFCRDKEFKTFNTAKKIKTIRPTNLVQYEAHFTNFIEAANSDKREGSTKINCARFSTDLVTKLLNIYAHKDGLLIYDPFMGSGTTAVGALMSGHTFIGSEISQKQVDWANTWISEYKEDGE